MSVDLVRWGIAYRLAPDATFDEWAEHGRAIMHAARAVQWLLGDWLNAGEDRFGEDYAQAVELTGLSERTLLVAAWVARSVPPEARRPNLPWTHHRVVAALPPSERDALLERCENEGWSERELRNQLRAMRGESGMASVADRYQVLRTVVLHNVEVLREAMENRDWVMVAQVVDSLSEAADAGAS